MVGDAPDYGVGGATSHRERQRANSSSSKISTKDSTPISRAQSNTSSNHESGGVSIATNKTRESSRVQSVASSVDEKKDSIINFVSGNPFVEVTKGILHLYKENETTSLEEGVLRSQMLCK